MKLYLTILTLLLYLQNLASQKVLGSVDLGTEKIAFIENNNTLALIFYCKNDSLKNDTIWSRKHSSELHDFVLTEDNFAVIFDTFHGDCLITLRRFQENPNFQFHTFIFREPNTGAEGYDNRQYEFLSEDILQFSHPFRKNKILYEMLDDGHIQEFGPKIKFHSFELGQARQDSLLKKYWHRKEK